mmetsp:Transcript_24850/g.34788  ORF Transcript_24850/g.34788 Transcript_24850/m.34788 type:complete len:188 (+) Transcript_24850:71-634(+)
MDNNNAEVMTLMKEGDQLWAQHNEQAIKKYEKALELCSPSAQHAVWILASLGEVYWQTSDYKNAFACFEGALIEAKSRTNPYLLLREGQLVYELSSTWKLTKDYMQKGKHFQASEDLAAALRGGGLAVFNGEDEKYLKWAMQSTATPKIGWNNYVAPESSVSHMRKAPEGTMIASVIASKLPGSKPS